MPSRHRHPAASERVDCLKPEWKIPLEMPQSVPFCAGAAHEAFMEAVSSNPHTPCLQLLLQDFCKRTCGVCDKAVPSEVCATVALGSHACLERLSRWSCATFIPLVITIFIPSPFYNPPYIYIYAYIYILYIYKHPLAKSQNF